MWFCSLRFVRRMSRHGSVTLRRRRRGHQDERIACTPSRACADGRRAVPRDSYSRSCSIPGYHIATIDIISRRRRRSGGRWGCGGCTRRWGSTRTTCTAAGVAFVFWRSWARVIRGRLPVIGRPNADILHHGPPPAYAHGREAVGEAEAWPQVHPGVVRGARAAAGLCVSGSRRAGGYRLSRPCSG